MEVDPDEVEQLLADGLLEPKTLEDGREVLVLSEKGRLAAEAQAAGGIQ
jgi:hypothetical protein